MTKRTSDQFLEIDDEQLSVDIDLDHVPIKESPDAIRRKIRAFIDSGEMKVGEFQKAIHCNSVAYSRFMGQNGPGKGAGSQVYVDAWAFFKRRELAGVRTNKKAKTAASEPAQDAQVALAGITLPGEMEDAVEVYDTCDEIRRKINAHLKKPGVTQAQFLRDVAAQYHQQERKIQSKQLNDFRSKKGPYSGNTSVVFYGAYVFFEKLRLKENKPKSKKRVEMESIHGSRGGLERDRVMNHFIVLAGTVPVLDQYGQVHTAQSLPRHFKPSSRR